MKRTDLPRAAVLAVLLLILLWLFLRDSTPLSQSTGSRPAGGSSPVSRTDANGVAWTLDQVGGPLVSTEPNAPKPGAPVVVKTDVQRVGEHEVSIGLLLEGQAGEQYRPVVKKNGTAIAAPRLRIVNEAGQVLVQGDFQYG